MIITVDIRPEVQAELARQAAAQGRPIEAIAADLLEDAVHLPADVYAAERPPEPFWKKFTRRIHGLPDEVFQGLPADGASEHDHYLYGSPKRNG
jgi:hypothetical protein